MYFIKGVLILFATLLNINLIYTQVIKKFETLSTVLSQFKDCHIHILLYQKIEFQNTADVPIVLDDLTDQKTWHLKYSKNDSMTVFHGGPWKCLVHAFMLPILDDGCQRFYIHPVTGVKRCAILFNTPTNLPFYFKDWITLSYGGDSRLKEVPPNDTTIFILLTEEGEYWWRFRFGFDVDYLSGLSHFQSAIYFLTEGSKNESLIVNQIAVLCPACNSGLKKLGNWTTRTTLNLDWRALHKQKITELALVDSNAMARSNYRVEKIGMVLQNVSFKNIDSIAVKLDEFLISLLLRNFTAPSYNMNFSNPEAPPTDKFHRIIYQSFHYMLEAYYNHRTHLLQLQWDALHFLTCDLKDEVYNFEKVLYPFDPYVWYFILSSISCLSAAAIIFRRFAMKNETIYQSFSISTFIVSLTEQSVDMDKIKKITSLQMLFGIWLPMTVILTNGYKGVIITTLTTNNQEKEFKNFGEMVDLNFSFYSLPYFKIKHKVSIQDCQADRRNCTVVHKKFGELVSYQRIRPLEGSPKSTDADKQKEFKYMKNIWERTKIPEDIFVENSSQLLPLISNCTRTAFIGYTNQIDQIEYDLRALYPNRVIKRGEETLSRKATGVQFTRWLDYDANIRFQSLFHSGIFQIWKILQGNLNQLRNVKSARNYTESLALDEGRVSMKDQFVVIFYLYLMGMCSGLLIFPVEYLFLLGKRTLVKIY